MTVLYKVEKGLHLPSKLQNTIVGYIWPGTVRVLSVLSENLVCTAISKMNIDFLLGAV